MDQDREIDSPDDQGDGAIEVTRKQRQVLDRGDDDQLNSLIATITAHHEAVVSSRRQTAAEAIEAGRGLLDMKRKVGHGKFGQSFEKAEFPFKPRTARNYQSLAKNEPFLTGKLASNANFDLGNAELGEALRRGKEFREEAEGLAEKLSAALDIISEIGDQLSSAELIATNKGVMAERVAPVAQCLAELAHHERFDTFADVEPDETDDEDEAQVDPDRPPASDGGAEPSTDHWVD